ncbi:RNA polymerase sigma factor [Streptomyces sp. NPDC055287]
MSTREFHDNEVIALFRLHSGAMLGSLMRKGIPPQAAEEIVNDVFAVVRRKWPQVRDGKPLSYAYRVADRLCARHWRTSLEEEKHLHFGEVEVADKRDEFEALMTKLSLFEAVRSLPRQQREVVRLRYLSEFSTRETAEKMGLSEGSVKSHLSDAIKALRSKVDGGDADEGREAQ